MNKTYDIKKIEFKNKYSYVTLNNGTVIRYPKKLVVVDVTWKDVLMPKDIKCIGNLK